MPTPEGWEALQEWLRYHDLWSVSINPWGIYGCVVLTAKNRGVLVYSEHGKSLDTRIQNFLEYVETFDRKVTTDVGR